MKVYVLMLSFVAVAIGISKKDEFEKLKQELLDLKEVMSLNLKSNWEQLNHDKIVELEHKIVKLEKENMVQKAKLEKIEKEELNHEIVELKLKLENLENPPSYHMCAYQWKVYKNSSVSVITYDKILYLSSHRCDEADVNLGTGVFTAGFPGTYTVTWALYASTNPLSRFYLRKNGARIDESEHCSSSTNGIWTYDQGKV